MNKSNILFCFLFSFFWMACGQPEEQKAELPPSYVIPKEKMVQILTDVNILEAAITLNVITDNKKLLLDSAKYINLYKKYNITKVDYDSSMNYYYRHLDDMQKIYDEVLNEISKKQAEINK